MKIVVTGAAGFVGSHLVPLLIANGFNVTSIVKNVQEKRTLPLKSKVIIADLSKKGPWQKQLKGNEIIIHLAAQISAKTPVLFQKNNVIATRNVVFAAKLSNIPKIILFSSAAVSSIRIDEYARTKQEKESIVKKSSLKYVILRPSMIYGPGDTKNIGWLISIVRKTPIVPLPGGGNFGRQPIYVGDICKIVIKLLRSDFKDNIYEIHGYQYVSMKKMVKVIAKNLKSGKLTINVPLGALFLATKINEAILSQPKFTTDQIKSLTSGEKFKGEAWWDTFDIIPTRFEAGVASMIK